MRYALTPWRKELERWPHGFGQNSLDQFFNNVFGVEEKPKGSQLIPAVDVEETESEFVLKMDLPGFKKEDISIEVQDNRLILSGERKTERVENSKALHLEERTFGQFTRSFQLPKNVDAEKVEANYSSGVLNLKLRKAENSKPKQIEIKG